MVVFYEGNTLRLRSLVARERRRGGGRRRDRFADAGAGHRGRGRTGEKVTKGQRLLTLEAMKMEHGLIAPFDGVVAEVNAVAGAQVSEGAVLARIEAVESSS